MLKEEVKMADSLPTLNLSNLEKIESFLNDPAYKEMIENSANYNTRLCIERRLRLPFLDNQTGVAQNHSNLYLPKRQRMPGLNPGQIYTYPRPRWRKKRRQYLLMNSRSFARTADALLEESDLHSISQMENPSLQDTDKLQDWYYDEQDMLEMDAYDEPDPDSDLDYEETYSKRSKRRKGVGRGRGGTDSPNTPGRRKGSGRGRKKGTHNFEPVGDPDKPFSCELCGARYKTRPGLTYHYSHSHKEGASDENSHDAAPTPSVAAGAAANNIPPASGIGGAAVTGGSPAMSGASNVAGDNANNDAQGANPGHVYQDSYVSFLNQPTAGNSARRRPGVNLPSQQSSPQSQAPPNLPPNLPNQQPTSAGDDPPMPVLVPEKTIDPPLQSSAVPSTATAPATPSSGALPTSNVEPSKDKATPSPYCDFCLGDARENKKTGGSEELVSCSDCGRSGHPSCLQFTPNMIISVKKYRWQCIECKCCSVCGTSDNDDQLLFCDDCDRGYHMYCLSPPLTTPPEGSWSCHLCIEHFHK
ncbi:zinc finger protein ubi-d4 B-like [Agrilus planipennis]|uniref:Zinc finger protein ubi-d4 B-like n=1 Tax=Agrilus planipennis TaxID=224129 RepID=A0A7F5RLA3_AGRPL|nr:zinc finger protein ubi-d4 B-like [Agrilus planipennis]